jgi:hypothetical protein
MPRTPSLEQWVDSYFDRQHVHPEIRKEVRTALKIAGFKDGVPVKRESLALKVAHQVVNKGGMSVQAEARVAAVVSGDGACPRCGSAMVDAKLATGTSTRYCSNPKCRVCAYVE